MALTEDEIHTAAKALYDAEREVGMSSWWNAHPRVRATFEARILAAQEPEAKDNEPLSKEDAAYKMGSMLREAIEAQIKREHENTLMAMAFVRGFLGQPPVNAPIWPVPNTGMVSGDKGGVLINETDIPLQPDTRNTEVLAEPTPDAVEIGPEYTPDEQY